MDQDNSSRVRQSSALANDERDVMGDGASAAAVEHGQVLVALFDRALPEVFGYLKPRCGDVAVAEDLTAETFLAACDAIERSHVTEVTVGWLIGIARHKLVDHWRREARQERHLRAVADLAEATVDPWDAQLDAASIERTLSALSAVNRSALTLRYLDGLSVPEVAELLDRTVAATDQVLARARASFRHHHGDADR
jgi:RNA polymerase sigma-70 factor (ECF subfamily)